MNTERVRLLPHPPRLFSATFTIDAHRAHVQITVSAELMDEVVPVLGDALSLEAMEFAELSVAVQAAQMADDRTAEVLGGVVTVSESGS